MKVAFIDRDGVVNTEVNYLHHERDLKLISSFVDGAKILRKAGFELIIITNQSGIARGYFTENEFNRLMSVIRFQLLNHGISFLDVFYCKHEPKDNCDCRKPKPGLIQQALSKYDIDLEQSIMIGDKISDVDAGIKAGVGKNFLVTTGHPFNMNDVPKNVVVIHKVADIFNV